MIKKKKDGGFALIELLVVMFIVLVVGTVGYITVRASRAEAIVSNNRIFVIGDSVLNYTNNSIDLREEFKKRGWNATIDGVPGRDLKHGLIHIKNKTVLNKIKASKVIVIELGLNDYDISTIQFNKDMSALYSYIKIVNPNIKVYWVTMAAFGQGNTSNDRARRTATRNKLIESYASGHKIVLVNWRNLAIKTDFTGNGIHPNETGKKKLANLLLRRIGQFNK